MSDTTRHPKYQPVVWATLDDALAAAGAESAGLVPLTKADKEGYLKFVGAYRPHIQKAVA